MPKTQPRLTIQSLRVLRTFLERPKDELSGADVAKKTGVLSGTLYPVLSRFETAGWLSSQWEKLDPSEAGRPRRRLYHLTAMGLRLARDVMKEFS